MATGKSDIITINISRRTIIFTIAVILALALIYAIRDVLVILFVSFLIVVAVNPIVAWLEQKRVPRALSTVGVLLVIFSILVGTIASIIGPLFSQTRVFIDRLPELVNQLAPYNIDFSSFTSNISSVPGDFLKFALTTFSGVISFFTMLVVSFYLIQTRPSWDRYMTTVFKAKGKQYYTILQQLEAKLGYWVRGEIFLMISVGLATYLGFILIGLPYAIPLGVIAGFLELIPNIGPTIAAVPAALVGFTISPTLGLLSILVSIIVQQLENHVLVPNIMRRAIGLNPIITIVTVLAGYRLGGPVLAVLALPLVLSIQLIISHLHIDDKTQEPVLE